MKKYIPHALLVAYLIEFVSLSFTPYSRAVWFADNVPLLFLVGFIVWLYRKNIRFSNLTYFLLFIGVVWHTIGGYYTFARVPFDCFNNFFGFERNMFDRVGHFTAGFFALPIIEYVYSRKLVSSKFVAVLFGVFAIAFVAASYECVEWAYAEYMSGHNAGIAFLGSQGDQWDAQKDMLMDMLGAVVVGLGWWRRKD